MPCRPSMQGCAASCGHYRIVSDYRDERRRQLDAADEESNGYAEEYEEYIRTHTLINFKQWLIQTRRTAT